MEHERSGLRDPVTGARFEMLAETLGYVRAPFVGGTFPQRTSPGVPISWPNAEHCPVRRG